MKKRKKLKKKYRVLLQKRLLFLTVNWELLNLLESQKHRQDQVAENYTALRSLDVRHLYYMFYISSSLKYFILKQSLITLLTYSNNLNIVASGLNSQGCQIFIKSFIFCKNSPLISNNLYFIDLIQSFLEFWYLKITKYCNFKIFLKS